MTGRVPAFLLAPLGPSDDPGGDVYRSFVRTSRLLGRDERAAEGVLDGGGRFFEASLSCEARSLFHAAVHLFVLLVGSFL